MPRETATDVLIVGAGPTGLTLANDLSRRGVSFRIIDKAPEPTRVSKAIVVHARNLELFENLGLIDHFLEKGLAVRGMNLFSGDQRIVHLNFDEIDSHYKYTLAISQAKTEEILGAALSRAGINVERSIEFLSFEQDQNSVKAKLKALKADGSVEDEMVTAKYVIGCDGAHSMARHGAGIAFNGAAYHEIFGAADVHVDVESGGKLLTEDEGYVYLGEAGVIVFIPFGSGRYRIIFGMPEDAQIDPESKLEFSKVLEVTKQRAPAQIKISDPHWLSWFRIHRRCASSYRSGRVFLAGDAGHIHSPVGGVGMNTGMQDAANLSWKLAMVVKGVADDRLLDTYQEERHQVGQAVLRGTDMATRVVTLRNPVAKNIRNMLMGVLASQELVQQRILKGGSLTGISYRASSLSSESHPPVEQSMTFGRTFRFGGQDIDAERPGLAAWMDFARGPVAGDRMLDGDVQNADGQPKRLAQIVASAKFKLLMFDGYAATDAGYEKLAEIEKQVVTKYGDYIDVHVILPFAKGRRVLPPYKSVIFDVERQLHKTYGASSECLYLVRPDGYIGFRGQPALFEELDAYFQTVFKVAAPVN